MNTFGILKFDDLDTQRSREQRRRKECLFILSFHSLYYYMRARCLVRVLVCSSFFKKSITLLLLSVVVVMPLLAFFHFILFSWYIINLFAFLSEILTLWYCCFSHQRAAPTPFSKHSKQLVCFFYLKNFQFFISSKLKNMAQKIF